MKHRSYTTLVKSVKVGGGGYVLDMKTLILKIDNGCISFFYFRTHEIMKIKTVA